MKRVFLNIALFAFASSLALTSCKKNETEPDYSELSQHAADNSSTQRETDQADDDATALLEGSSLSGARIGGGTSAFTVDSSKTVKIGLKDRKKFQIIYNNQLVDGKTRSGKVTAILTSGEKWSEAGAVLTLTFDTVKVTRNGRSVTFNGTKVITNVLGGRVKDVKAGTTSSVKHSVIASDLKITFDDATTRTWNVSKTRTFTKTNDGMQISVEGTGSSAGYTNLAEWGITRKGTLFYSTIDKPLVFSECSNDPKPISGKKTHKGLIKEASVTFAVDANGNEVNSCSATHFKLNWINRKGETQSAILEY